MNLSPEDYMRLYQMQDKFLLWWKTLSLPFYLTGGTALGRFYLHHRFSEDLDFFCNSDPGYSHYIAELKNKIEEHFVVDSQQSMFTEDFSRFFINENDLFLKIDFVNDVAYFSGRPIPCSFGLIDTPLNIISNKLNAIIGRDEPKDVFDIVYLALNYSFSWPEIFYHSKQKSVINEIDIARRLNTFPVEWLKNVNWIRSFPDLLTIERNIQTIADDFLLGKENSLGKDKINIQNAMPDSQFIGVL